MGAPAREQNRTPARNFVLAVGLAVVGFAVPVFLLPVVVRAIHPDPLEWEPSDSEMRLALGELPFAVRYHVTQVDGGLRWYRGRAVRRGVPVRFAFLVGSGAGERADAPEHFHLLPGLPDIGGEAPSFKLVYQSDASLLPDDTATDRARQNIAFDTSFSIVDAVTAKRD
jgi:hypothetical protein